MKNPRHQSPTRYANQEVSYFIGEGMNPVSGFIGEGMNPVSGFIGEGMNPVSGYTASDDL